MLAVEQGVDFVAVGHGRGGAGAGDGDAGNSAAEACGGDDVLAFGESYREAAVEGVAGTGGFDDGAGVDRGDVGAGGGVFEEDSLRAEGDDGVADAAGEERVGGLLGGGERGDADAGEDFGFALVGGDVVAEREEGGGQGAGGRGIEDGGDAERVCELEAEFDGGEREFELGDEDGGVLDERAGLFDFGGGEFEAGAGDDDDGVLAARLRR